MNIGEEISTYRYIQTFRYQDRVIRARENWSCSGILNEIGVSTTKLEGSYPDEVVNV